MDTYAKGKEMMTWYPLVESAFCGLVREMVTRLPTQIHARPVVVRCFHQRIFSTTNNVSNAHGDRGGAIDSPGWVHLRGWALRTISSLPVSESARLETGIRGLRA